MNPKSFIFQTHAQIFFSTNYAICIVQVVCLVCSLQFEITVRQVFIFYFLQCQIKAMQQYFQLESDYTNFNVTKVNVFPKRPWAFDKLLDEKSRYNN